MLNKRENHEDAEKEVVLSNCHSIGKIFLIMMSQAIKDVRANCLCASLLRMQFMSQRHAQRKKSIHLRGWYPLL